jgi:hypothetical protein
VIFLGGTMRVFASLIVLAVFSFNSFAETIYLKSGGTVSVKILKTTPTFIKGESDGESVIYFTDEIATIEKDAPENASTYNEQIVDAALTAIDVESLAVWLRDELCKYVMKYDNRIDASMSSAVRSIIYDSYDIKTFYAISKAAFSQQFDRNMLFNVNKFLHSPGIKAVADTRRLLVNGSYKDRWALFLEQAKLNNFDQKRLEAIAALDDVSAFSDFTGNFVYTGLMTIARNQHISKIGLMADVRDDVRNVFYFIFQDSSDAVIQAHSRVAVNKDIRWFNYWLRSAVLEANVMFSNVAAKKVDEYVALVIAEREAHKSKKEKDKENAAKMAEEKNIKRRELKQKAKKKLENKVLDVDKNVNKSNLIPASWVDKK